MIFILCVCVWLFNSDILNKCKEDKEVNVGYVLRW